MESSQNSVPPPFAAFDFPVPSPGWDGRASIGSAATRLTDKILGNNSDDLARHPEGDCFRARSVAHFVRALCLQQELGRQLAYRDRYVF